jgi:hypothetical protein
MHSETRGQLRHQLGLDKSSWNQAGELGPFLRSLEDHEFASSTQDMTEDSAMFFNILFPNQPGLVDGAGIMLDYDRCVMWVLNLERVRVNSCSTRT